MAWFERNIRTRVFDYGWAYRRRISTLRGGADPAVYLGGAERPVLVLPGVYETWHFLEPVAQHLHDHGHPVHVVPGFGRNIRPIADMAELARRYLVEQGLRDVAIVGHSKGGLIGKTLMLTDDGLERVASMVAINSPFGGSDYAKFVPVRPLREFVPTHETIRSLTGSADVNARITSVYAEWDPIIPNGSLLEGATNVTLAASGHFRVLDRPDLLEIVHRSVRAR